MPASTANARAATLARIMTREPGRCGASTTLPEAEGSSSSRYARTGSAMFLNRGSALDGIDATREFDQRPVAHEFDHAAAEFLDRRVDQFATATFQQLERTDFVLAHERAESDHVGSKYRGKPSLHTCLRPPGRSSGFAAAYSSPASDASVRDR